MIISQNRLLPVKKCHFGTLHGVKNNVFELLMDEIRRLRLVWTCIKPVRSPYIAHGWSTSPCTNTYVSIGCVNICLTLLLILQIYWTNLHAFFYLDFLEKGWRGYIPSREWVDKLFHRSYFVLQYQHNFISC